MTHFCRNIIFCLLLVFTSFSATIMAAENCAVEKAKFKELYIALQQSLNYEGKDASLEKGALVLKPHKKDAAYEGKVFEEALYKEYQHTLKKVGALYQSIKFDKGDKSNSELVKFVKAVDSQDAEIAEYVKNNKVDNIIDQLQAASKQKYGEKHPAIIGDNDKYLLKKLLTHAQDRICSVDLFEKQEKATGKQQKSKHFSAEELNRVRNAPLNRLINSIKNGNISADSDLKIADLKDTDKAITLAIAKNMAALKDWKQKNERCLKSIANPAFIQSGIQLCNYTRFVQTLDQGNETNLESILHFINSNEKFLNRPAAKAETALDELKLEAAIDSAFSGIGKKSKCAEVKTKNNKIFVANLTYMEDKKTFDYSSLEINCQNGSKLIDKSSCEKSLEFISDSTGEGMEIRSKLKAPGFKLSVKAKGQCTSEATLTSDDKVTPPVVGQGLQFKTEEQCLAEGTAQKKMLTLSEDKKSCIEKKAEKKEEKKEEKTQVMCDEEGKKENKLLIVSEDKKTCVEKKDEKKDELKTQAMCDEQSKKENKSLTLSDDKKSCIEKKDELKTQAMCDEQGKKENKTLTLSEDKKSCIEKKDEKKDEPKAKLSRREQCEADNAKWLGEAEEGDVRTDRHIWDEKTKSCNDKQKKPSEKNEEEEASKPEPVYAPTQAPPRFTPVNIPTRQMYIMPGMP